MRVFCLHIRDLGVRRGAPDEPLQGPDGVLEVGDLERLRALADRALPGAERHERTTHKGQHMSPQQHKARCARSLAVGDLVDDDFYSAVSCYTNLRIQSDLGYRYARRRSQATDLAVESTEIDADDGHGVRIVVRGVGGMGVVTRACRIDWEAEHAATLFYAPKIWCAPD